MRPRKSSFLTQLAGTSYNTTIYTSAEPIKGVELCQSQPVSEVIVKVAVVEEDVVVKVLGIKSLLQSVHAEQDIVNVLIPRQNHNGSIDLSTPWMLCHLAGHCFAHVDALTMHVGFEVRPAQKLWLNIPQECFIIALIVARERNKTED